MCGAHDLHPLSQRVPLHGAQNLLLLRGPRDHSTLPQPQDHNTQGYQEQGQKAGGVSQLLWGLRGTGLTFNTYLVAFSCSNLDVNKIIKIIKLIIKIKISIIFEFISGFGPQSE